MTTEKETAKKRQKKDSKPDSKSDNDKHNSPTSTNKHRLREHKYRDVVALNHNKSRKHL